MTKSTSRVSKARTLRRPSKRVNGLKQEPFKLVTRPQIRAVVRRIVETLDPEKVILFGSYAYGKPTIDGDVDMLIVMETAASPTQRTVRTLEAIRGVKNFPMDILVRTPREISHRLKIGDFFVKEITERGQVLYERRAH